MVDSFAAQEGVEQWPCLSGHAFGRVSPATKKAAARHGQRYGDLLGGEARATWP